MIESALKTLVLGDIHGRDIWKKIIEKEAPERVIFLGDYLTSHEGISEEVQASNFLEILEYKENNPKTVILLRGNHDMEALGYPWAACGPEFYNKKIFTENDGELKNRFLKNTQWLYKDGNTIFSHAGISKHWYEETIKRHLSGDIESINDVEPNGCFGFIPGPDNLYDYCGESIYQSLTWIRAWTLLTDPIEGYNQVVGHTTLKKVVEQEKDGMKFYFCDTLGTGSYLTFEDGQPKINFL